MDKREEIPSDLMDIAVYIEKDIPSRITGENRVFIRAVIARALSQARSQAYEECAVLAYIECAKTRHLKLGEDVAQAIRQHSQKGGENGK